VGSAASLEIQCADPSHARRGDCFLQKVANSRTGVPLCYPFWCVYERQGASVWSCRPKAFQPTPSLVRSVRIILSFPVKKWCCNRKSAVGPAPTAGVGSRWYERPPLSKLAR
jgi:hypothetical protein